MNKSGFMSLTEFWAHRSIPTPGKVSFSRHSSGHKQHRHKTKPALLTMAYKVMSNASSLTPYPLLRAHGSLPSPAYTLTLRYAKFSPTTRPLHLPFPLWGMLFLQPITWPAPPCPSALSLPRCLSQEGPSSPRTPLK